MSFSEHALLCRIGCWLCRVSEIEKTQWTGRGAKSDNRTNAKYDFSKWTRFLWIQQLLLSLVHSTLDDMKNSLSFISTTLATNEKKGKLSHQEISQLQDRLASTEAQMYKILGALDAASSKVQEITKNTRQSLEQHPQVCVEKEKNTSYFICHFRLFVASRWRKSCPSLITISEW
jgi:septal ring factor EnvC (AmiA/AmiB activator)